MPNIKVGATTPIYLPAGQRIYITGVGEYSFIATSTTGQTLDQGTGDNESFIGPYAAQCSVGVTATAAANLTYEIARASAVPDIVYQNTIPATRAEAVDGLATDALSSPLNVAQQIAATLPPGCTVLNFGTVPLGSLLSGSSTDAAVAVASAGPISLVPSSPTSRMLVIASWTMEATAEAADTVIQLLNELRYYNGSAYVAAGTEQRVAVGGASSTALQIRGAVTFPFELTVAQRRTDSSQQWTIRPYVQSISGAAWANLGGTIMFVEVDGADTTTAGADVYDIVSFVSYGQSLGAGAFSTPAKTTTAVRPGRALMPEAGVRPLGAQTGASENTAVTPVMLKTLVNLREATVSSNGETPSSTAAYMLTGENGMPSYEAVEFSNHSIGGLAISALSAGTVPYSNIMTTLRRVRFLARRNGLNHRAAGLFFTQGEADRALAQSAYLERLLALQASLTTDIRAIDRGTGQLLVFVDQLHNWTSYNLTESAVPFAQLQAALENPEKVIMVGPKYMLQTVGDGTHITADAEAWLGAYQGEIARRVLVLREKWLPTHIKTATRIGATVVLDYHVPDGALVIDTTLVTDPGSNGFRWIQTGGNSVTVSSVAITGKKQITLTLSAIPTGTAQQVGYADIGVSGAAGGPLTGPRGNVRDQATATGLYGETLYNWAAVQRKDVTV